jgi:hypothetical protein
MLSGADRPVGGTPQKKNTQSTNQPNQPINRAQRDEGGGAWRFFFFFE